MKILHPLPSLAGTEAAAEHSVTVLVNFTVALEQKTTYLDALKRLLQQFEAFPGTIGHKVFQQEEQGTLRVTIVQRFNGEQAYKNWLGSAPFAAWEQDISRIDHRLDNVHRYSGMEALFAAGRSAGAPPRWKMCVVLFIAVFPLSLALSHFFGTQLASIPPLTGSLLSSPVMVILMTYVMVPILTKVFARWLQPLP